MKSIGLLTPKQEEMLTESLMRRVESEIVSRLSEASKADLIKRYKNKEK